MVKPTAEHLEEERLPRRRAVGAARARRDRRSGGLRLPDSRTRLRRHCLRGQAEGLAEALAALDEEVSRVARGAGDRAGRAWLTPLADTHAIRFVSLLRHPGFATLRADPRRQPAALGGGCCFPALTALSCCCRAGAAARQQRSNISSTKHLSRSREAARAFAWRRSPWDKPADAPVNRRGPSRASASGGPFRRKNAHHRGCAIRRRNARCERGHIQYPYFETGTTLSRGSGPKLFRRQNAYAR